MRTTWLIACVGLAPLPGAAHADVAFNTLGPGDTYSGNGFLVYGPNASPVIHHAFQFTSQASGNLSALVVPIQHFGGVSNGFTFELFSDAGNTPGTSLGAIGQAPGLIMNTPPYPAPVTIPAGQPLPLSAGTKYWVVVRGIGDMLGSCRANDQNITGRRAFDNAGSGWIVDTQVTAAFRVEVATAGGCYPNCDSSTAVPVLNVGDFTCFLTKFAGGDPYANCDGSTAVPVLNVGDFTCFLTKFAGGCP